MEKLLPLAVLALTGAVPAAAQTLDETIADALARAPQMEAADAEADAVRAQRDQARAANAVTATVQGSAGVGYLDMHGFFNMGSDSVVPLSGQLTVEKPLFTGGRIAGAVAQANAGVEASEAARQMARSDVVNQAAETHTGVLLAQKQVGLMEQSVAQMRRVERDARLMFQAGAAPRTDLAQAGARLAEAEAGLAQAEGNLASARTRYRLVTGKEAGTLTQAAAGRALPATLNEAIERATSANAALVRARAGVKAASAGVKTAKAERLPTIGAFAEGAAIRDQFFPDYKADSATVGVRARWRFFDGGMTTARINEASAKERTAEAQLRGAELMVEQQVTASWYALRTAEEVLRSTNAQQAAANEALTNARLEFQIGAKPQLALLDAQREATAAGLAVAQAESQLLLARTRLLTLLGDYGSGDRQ